MPVKDHNYIRGEPWIMTEVWHLNDVHVANPRYLPGSFFAKTY